MKKSLGPETFVYPTPVWVVGTYDRNDRPNVMTAAWGGVCCSEPPCVAVSLRKARHTYGAIVEREAFTISIPSETHAKETDYFGLVSGAEEDKFAATGLTAVGSELVDAPYVGEFPLVLECKLIQAIELGVHTQFVGQIVDVKADEDVLAKGDVPDIERLRPIAFAPGTNSYHGVCRSLGKAYSIGKKRS